MRSVPSGSFRRLCEPQTLWRAWREVRRGKRRGPAIADFELDADRHLLAFSQALEAGAYRPGPAELRTMRDPKLRLISAPPVRDRIVHRALLDDIGPTYERSYLDQCCHTRGRGTGTHQAVLAFLGAMRRYAWRCHLDIATYFPSVDLERLEALLFRRLADPNTRRLIGLLLDGGARVYRTAAARQILGPPRKGAMGYPWGRISASGAAIFTWMDSITSSSAN